MAKRFIDTNFFKDPFVRGLRGSLKGLYVYLFLDCSNAGLWDVELDVARIRCDIPENISDNDLKSQFATKIIEVENGEKWLVKNFIKIQHSGQLKQNNNAHISAIEELKKYDLLSEKEDGIFILKEGLSSPSKGSLSDPIVKVMVKEKGNGNSKGNGLKKFTKKDFKKMLLDLGANEQHIDDWFIVRTQKKGVFTKTAFKKILNECEKNNYPVADAVQNCAERGWVGFEYKWLENLQLNGNRNNSNLNGNPASVQGTFNEIDRMYGD